MSRGLVYALVRMGKIRHERHGTGRGTVRIPADALDDYRRAASRPEQPKFEVTPCHSS